MISLQRISADNSSWRLVSEKVHYLAHELGAGQHRVVCPFCGRGAHDKTFGILVHPLETKAHCFRCGVKYNSPASTKNYFDASKQKLLEQGINKKGLSTYWQSLWLQCEPITSIAESYLTARACKIPPADGHLRWDPRHRHPSGYVGPCLVALITDFDTCENLSLHRTWISADGSKANVDNPKLVLKGYTTVSGVIRLWPDEAVKKKLGLAEGIETALSLAHADFPVWAAVNAGNLQKLNVRESLEELTIAVDADHAGREASFTCARRWTAAGKKVRLLEVKAGDLNDYVKGMQ